MRTLPSARGLTAREDWKNSNKSTEKSLPYKNERDFLCNFLLPEGVKD
jgi:hypothetical protein